MVFTFGADKADFRGANFVVNAGASIASGRRVVRSAGYGFVPSVVEKRLEA